VNFVGSSLNVHQSLIPLRRPVVTNHFLDSLYARLPYVSQYKQLLFPQTTDLCNGN